MLRLAERRNFFVIAHIAVFKGVARAQAADGRPHHKTRRSSRTRGKKHLLSFLLSASCGPDCSRGPDEQEFPASGSGERTGFIPGKAKLPFRQPRKSTGAFVHVVKRTVLSLKLLSYDTPAVVSPWAKAQAGKRYSFKKGLDQLVILPGGAPGVVPNHCPPLG